MPKKCKPKTKTWSSQNKKSSNTIKNSKSIDSVKDSMKAPNSSKKKVDAGDTSTMNGLKKNPKTAILIIAKNMKKKK